MGWFLYDRDLCYETVKAEAKSLELLRSLSVPLLKLSRPFHFLGPPNMSNTFSRISFLV